MTRIQHRLSTVLIAVMLWPLWVYGGAKESAGASTSAMPPVGLGGGQAVVHQGVEMAALDAGSPIPWAGEDRQQAQSLIARLKERGIAIQPSFYKLLGMASPAQRGKLVSRCQVFFDSVNTREVVNTCGLTSMIQKKKHVCSFLSHSDDSVRRVARTPALRSLTSLFNNRGFPKEEEDTQAFTEWEVWWCPGEGKARTLDRELLRMFSSIFHGKGLPGKKVVEDYLQWEVWWQGEGNARTLDRKLLRTFSSMFRGKGLPDKKAVDDYLKWELWWQGEGNVCTLDRELLRAFSSMFNGRGLPDKKAVDDYLQLDVWWQGEGDGRTLDRQLLRAFSSMFHGKGLPDKKAVEDYLQLEVWWQRKGQAYTLDRDLLRIFSSMYSSNGLPRKKAVDDYLNRDVWWHGDGETRTLDRDLLRAFSSMFSGRGLPDKKAVEDYLQLDVWWQGAGQARTLDRQLLRTFSAMLHSKGLPDKKAVENYLKWEVWWSGEGKVRTLDRELLRIFSSMFSGRGLPNKKTVEDYLQLNVWWQGQGKVRTLDRELLRTFSSMLNGKGLPDKRVVEDYLQWEVWWQGEGEGRRLDRKLLRVFSSMFDHRGLPDKKAVEDYLQWDVWWQGHGQARRLDRELLRIVSSMFTRTGLPKKEAVEDYLQWEIWWRGGGQAHRLDRGLLRIFSSLFHGLGLPEKKAVEDYLKWPLWWQGEGETRLLDRERLHTFSSLFHGKGFPEQKAVEDYLKWPFWWQGEGGARTLDWGRLRTFSSMVYGKGLPEKLRINGILQWLTGDEPLRRQTLKVMANLYSGTYVGHKPLGLPDIKKLRRMEQKLMALIAPEERAQDEDNDILPLIKMVALYLANDGGTRQLHWTDCEAWLQEHPRPLPKISLFRQLLRTLHYYGGQGIKKAVALISAKPLATKWFVLDAMDNGQALAPVQWALEIIEAGERQDYLFFTRELHPQPSHGQWETIKGYLTTLTPVMPQQEYRRRFLTLIWPFAAADRERFVQPEAVRMLVTLLPSIQVMRNLSKLLTTDELRTLFDTCLAYRSGQPDQQGLPILFKGLLLAHLPLLEPGGAIPPGILAQTHDQPEGVVIGVNPAIGVENSITLFIQVMAVLLQELWDCEYTVNGQTLTLWPHGQTVPITLPTPSLGWHPDGVQIRHWSLDHLHRFYQATECWQELYREPAELPAPESDATVARPEQSHRNHIADVEHQGQPPVLYLTVAALRGILKNRVHMTPVAWASADYHKDKLSPSLLALLKEQADADGRGLVPESLKRFLSEREQPSQVVATPAYPSAIWLETMLRQSVLSEADLDQLYNYRDQLSRDQVVDISFRMYQGVSQDTMRRWQLLLSKRHQQTLSSNPLWLDGSNQAMESVRDVEDILRDLFPDDWL